MENVKETIAKNLVLLRKSRKMTQQELATVLNYSDKAISRWEHAETMPDIETLCRVCAFYGVRFEYLLQEQQPDGKNPYVVQKNIMNELAIALIAVFSVWLIASVIYVSFNWIFAKNAWQIFIWAIPATFLVALFCNKLWGGRLCGDILASCFAWSLVLAVYIALLPYNIWPLFLIGVPIQLIIIFAAFLKK